MSRGLRDRFAPPSTTTMMTKTTKNQVPSIIFPRGSNFADVRRFGNVIMLLSPPQTHDVSRMKDFRREVILIALNKPRFAFIIFAYRWLCWLNELQDRDLIQRKTRNEFCRRTKKRICFCIKSIFSRLSIILLYRRLSHDWLSKIKFAIITDYISVKYHKVEILCFSSKLIKKFIKKRGEGDWCKRLLLYYYNTYF